MRVAAMPTKARKCSPRAVGRSVVVALQKSAVPVREWNAEVSRRLTEVIDEARVGRPCVAVASTGNLPCAPRGRLVSGRQPCSPARMRATVVVSVRTPCVVAGSMPVSSRTRRRR